MKAVFRWARDIRTDNVEFVCQDVTKLSFVGEAELKDALERAGWKT